MKKFTKVLSLITILFTFQLSQLYFLTAQNEINEKFQKSYQLNKYKSDLNTKQLVNNNSNQFDIRVKDYVLQGANELNINIIKSKDNTLPDNAVMKIKIDGVLIEDNLDLSKLNISSNDILSHKINYDFGEAGSKHNVSIKLFYSENNVINEYNGTILTVNGFSSKKMVLMEMACGILCGPCLAHIEEAHHFINTHKDSLALAIYNKAPVGSGVWDDNDKPYHSFHKTFNIGYQSSVMMDRTFDADNLNSQEGNDTEVINDMTKAYYKQLNSEYVPVNVSAVATYDANTRNVKLDLSASFTDYAEGDMRFYVVLTQDTVIGPNGTSITTSYAQGTMASYDGVYGYQGENLFGSWYAIPGYPHTNVVKYQPNGFFGKQGIINSRSYLVMFLKIILILLCLNTEIRVLVMM